jgi:hypothetical protein
MFILYKIISENKTIRLNIKKQGFNFLKYNNLKLNRECVISLA